MSIIPDRLDELIEGNFEAIDRHYPVIITIALLSLVTGAIALALALDCNAGEFLGLAAVAIGLGVAMDRVHASYYDRVKGRG